MTIHHSTCPICASPSLRHFLSCVDHTVSHETYSLVKCEDCKFTFTQDIPSEQAIGRYYQSESYISHTGSNKGLINKLYLAVRNYSLRQKTKLVSSHTAGRNIIDYGCGTGEFLNSCKTAGWSVQGYEPSDQARETAITKNTIPVNTPAELSAYLSESADIITLWHVLEHVHQLKPTLSELLSKLKKGGILLIAVPNCSSFDAKHYRDMWAAYDVPRHLYHFEPKTIHALLSQLGLTRLAIRPMVFDSFYVSLLSEKHRANGKLSIFSLLRGFSIGLLSNLKARLNGQTYSSQIYIYQK